MFTQNPKISIITVCFNSHKTIKDTIDSVLGQTYKNVEYIIVDGHSTDDTVGLVKSYGDSISKFVSEPDSGIYDAMNKGIALATGDIIGILNSDDFYAYPDVLQDVVRAFEANPIDALYGDLTYVSYSNTSTIIRYWKSKPYQKNLFKKGWHPAHPTFFVKKECYEKYGLFNTAFKISADYELMLRFIMKFEIKTYYIDKLMVKMRLGGQSNKSISKIIESNIEVCRAWRHNQLNVNPVLIFRKLLLKALQLTYKKT